MMTAQTTGNPIGVHALVWVGDTSPSSSSLTHAIEKTRATGFDLLEPSLHDSVNLDVEAAREGLEAAGLGVACSRGLAFDRQLSEAGRRNVVTVLRRLAQDARRLGMTLGIEICNRYETNVVKTAHDALVSSTTSARTTCSSTSTPTI